MTTFTRVDTSVVGRWWWTVDRGILLAIALLITIGTILSLAASPAVATRLGLDSHHFVQRQFLFLVPATAIMLAVSLLPPLVVRRIAAILFIVVVPMMILTLLVGADIKGSRRWLRIAGLTIQPSEFLKPAFIVVSAWMLSEVQRTPGFPGIRISFCLYAVIVGLLLLQPDIGQTVLLTAVWLAQLFLTGVSWYWIGAVSATAAGGAVIIYSAVPHVAQRVNIFLDPALGDNYQIKTSLDAFRTGGLFGRGPGKASSNKFCPTPTPILFSRLRARSSG